MAKRSRSRSKKPVSSKRERFEAAGKFPTKKVIAMTLAVAVVVAGIVVGVKLRGESAKVGGPVVVEAGADYSDAAVQMSLLQSANVADTGLVTLSVAEITARQIGGFVYNRSTPMPADYAIIENEGLPVLAYVAPSGRVVVATSLCEPCRSYSFHISGSDLVCNSCFTRWDLNTLKGVSGGCLDYPPDQLSVTVEGDLVQIDRSVLEAWAPRI